MYGERRPEFDPNQLIDQLRQGFQRFASALPGGGGASVATTLIVVVIAAFWLASGVYQVAPDEQAAVQVFGKFRTISDPGLSWNWPAPIGNVQKESVTQNKTMELGFRSNQGIDIPVESLMITGDLNIVDVKMAVQYRIGDLRAFLFQVDDPGDADRGGRAGKPDGRTLRDATEASLRQVVGQRGIDDVLIREKERVQSDTAELLQGLMESYGTGLEILSVQLQEVTPPDAVRAAFDDVVAARSEKETRVNQADAYEQDRIPRADGAARTTIEAAEAFKTARVSRAQGEAAEFTTILAEYEKSPTVTRQRLFLEAMEEILPGVTLFVIDDEAGSGVLPFLPLTGGVPEIPLAGGTRYHD
jgi:membrane protease subunit HflK